MKVTVDKLPRNIKLLANLIGLDAALKLVSALGGQTIWPCKHGDGFAELSALIGDESAHRFVMHFREPFFVPKCDEAIRSQHRNAIRQQFDTLTGSGLSARQAVAQLAGQPPMRYTDRHIWRILSSTDEGITADTGQAELF